MQANWIISQSGSTKAEPVYDKSRTRHHLLPAYSLSFGDEMQLAYAAMTAFPSQQPSTLLKFNIEPKRARNTCWEKGHSHGLQRLKQVDDSLAVACALERVAQPFQSFVKTISRSGTSRLNELGLVLDYYISKTVVENSPKHVA